MHGELRGYLQTHKKVFEPPCSDYRSDVITTTDNTPCAGVISLRLGCYPFNSTMGLVGIS